MRAKPDTTPAGRAAYKRDAGELGPIYRAAQDVVRSSPNPVAVRRAVCQALIAKRLGFGLATVHAHLAPAKPDSRYCDECGAAHGEQPHAFNFVSEVLSPEAQASGIYLDEAGQ